MEFKVDKKISENITVCKTNLTINKYAVVFGELDKPVFVALRKSKTSAINVAAKALKKNNGLKHRCFLFVIVISLRCTRPRPERFWEVC